MAVTAPPGRVAVLRANALGDLIVSLPALEALRAAYPGAEIVLLGTPLHFELFAGRPAPVDRVAVVPVSWGVRHPAPTEEEDPAEIEAFFTRMRAQRFDLAVQLHGGGRWSNPFVRHLGAELTVGAKATDADPLDRTVAFALHQHEVPRLLEVVALAGAEPVTYQPRLERTPLDRTEANRVLGDLAGPLVGIHPGVGDPRRRWPPQRFAALGDAVAAAGAQVVITGSAAERDLAERVASLMRAPAVVVAGRTRLAGLIGVLERCLVLVANDTGPRHLAEAVGTASVSIFWCGNLMAAGPLTRHRHRAHVSWRLSCPVCGNRTMGDIYPARHSDPDCGHRESFVTDVPLDEVLPDVLDLYAEELQRRGTVDAEAATAPLSGRSAESVR